MSKRVNNRRGRRRVKRPDSYVRAGRADGSAVLRFWKRFDRIVEESKENVRARERERNRRRGAGIFA